MGGLYVPVTERAMLVEALASVSSPKLDWSMGRDYTRHLTCPMLNLLTDAIVSLLT